MTAPTRAAERFAATVVLTYAEDLKAAPVGMAVWWENLSHLCRVRQQMIEVCGDELRARQILAAVAATRHADHGAIA